MKKLLALALITIVFSACSLISQKTDPDSAPKPEGDKQIISDESKELVNAQTDNEFLQSAISSKDKSFCENIQNTEKKNDCMIIVADLNLLDEAVSKRDKELCEKISLDNYKLACTSNIDSIEKQDGEQEEIVNRLQTQMDEYNKIELRAIEAKDYKICDEISDENVRGSCQFNVITSIVRETGEITLCDNIKDDIGVQLCKTTMNEL